MNNDKKRSIIKSRYFIRLFLFPCCCWFIFSIFTMINPGSSLTLGEFISGNLFLDFIWFIISYVVSFFYFKNEEKNKKRVVTNEKKWEEMSIFKKIRLSLIMSVITFILGILIFFPSIGFPLKVQIIAFLLSFIPFVLFLFFTFIIYKNKEKKKVFYTFKTFSIVLTFSLILYYFIALFYITIFEATNPMTNPKYYWFHKPNFDVFPGKIPSSAKDASFIYFPGVLQGGTRYTLYYVDNNMTLDEFDEKYNDKAKWIGHMDDYKDNRGLLDGAFYYTPSEFKNENDYTIYLIEGKCDDSGYCNHGSFVIAAFNEKTNQVVYSAETW